MLFKVSPQVAAHLLASEWVACHSDLSQQRYVSQPPHTLRCIHHPVAAQQQHTQLRQAGTHAASTWGCWVDAPDGVFLQPQLLQPDKAGEHLRVKHPGPQVT
jgi:hypothetical protein